MHVGRRLVERRIDRDPGERRTQIVQRIHHALGHARHARRRQLLHEEYEPGAVLGDPVADQGLVALDDGGDAAERRLARGVRDRHAREVLGGAQREDRADVNPLVGPVEEAARSGRGALKVGERRDELCVAGRVDDLLQGDVRGGEFGRVDLDLELAVLLTEDRDIRDAGDAGQARLEHPPREIGELDRTELRRIETDQQRPAVGGQWLNEQRRLVDGRQRERVRQALLDELAGVERCRSWLEIQIDGRQARRRVRPHVPDAHHTVEEVVLHRNRDVLLDLLAGETRRLGLHLKHRALGELRQHIGVHLRERDDPEPDQPGGEADEQHPEAQGDREQPRQTHVSASGSRSVPEPAVMREVQCDISPQTSCAWLIPKTALKTSL